MASRSTSHWIHPLSVRLDPQNAKLWIERVIVPLIRDGFTDRALHFPRDIATKNGPKIVPLIPALLSLFNRTNSSPTDSSETAAASDRAEFNGALIPLEAARADSQAAQALWGYLSMAWFTDNEMDQELDSKHIVAMLISIQTSLLLSFSTNNSVFCDGKSTPQKIKHMKPTPQKLEQPNSTSQKLAETGADGPSGNRAPIDWIRIEPCISNLELLAKHYWEIVGWERNRVGLLCHLLRTTLDFAKTFKSFRSELGSLSRQSWINQIHAALAHEILCRIDSSRVLGIDTGNRPKWRQTLKHVAWLAFGDVGDLAAQTDPEYIQFLRSIPQLAL